MKTLERNNWNSSCMYVRADKGNFNICNLWLALLDLWSVLFKLVPLINLPALNSPKKTWMSHYSCLKKERIFCLKPISCWILIVYVIQVSVKQTGTYLEEGGDISISRAHFHINSEIGVNLNASVWTLWYHKLWNQGIFICILELTFLSEAK